MELADTVDLFTDVLGGKRGLGLALSPQEERTKEAEQKIEDTLKARTLRVTVPLYNPPLHQKLRKGLFKVKYKVEPAPTPLGQVYDVVILRQGDPYSEGVWNASPVLAFYHPRHKKDALIAARPENENAIRYVGTSTFCKYPAEDEDNGIFSLCADTKISTAYLDQGRWQEIWDWLAKQPDGEYLVTGNR